MDLVKGSLNPTMYWGVSGRGFKYGDKVIMDPEDQDVILSVIDSGTTLMILPQVVMDGLVNQVSERMRYDSQVNMVCTRDPESH